MSTALTLLGPVDGWDLYRDINAGVWVRDLDVATYAGLVKPRDIRKTIGRAVGDGSLRDGRYQPKTSSKFGRHHDGARKTQGFGNAPASDQPKPSSNFGRHHDGARKTQGFGAPVGSDEQKTSGNFGRAHERARNTQAFSPDDACFLEVLETIVTGMNRPQEVRVYYLNLAGVLLILRRLRTKTAEALIINALMRAVRVFDAAAKIPILEAERAYSLSEDRIRAIVRDELQNTNMPAFTLPPASFEVVNDVPQSKPFMPIPMSRLEKTERLYDALADKGYSSLRVKRAIKALDEYIDALSLEDLTQEGVNLLMQRNVLQAPELDPPAIAREQPKPPEPALAIHEAPILPQQQDVPTPLTKETLLHDALSNEGYPDNRVQRVVKALAGKMQICSLEELTREGFLILSRSHRGHSVDVITPEMAIATPDLATPSQSLASRFEGCFDNVPMHASARLLMISLLRCADNETGIAAVTMKRLCQMTALSRQTIYKQREVLKTLGYISTHVHVDELGQAPSQYKLHFDAFPPQKHRS